MHFEHSETVQASPERIFALYADVARWNVWDPDLKTSSIDGPFASGATGTVEPKSGPKSRVLFTDVAQHRGFAVECKLPLCVMRFEHRLEPQGASTLVTHGVRFRGPLAWFFGLVIGSGMKKSLPHAVRSLQAVAEST
jgi:Polyketide cyclase / dehydrase and lipid transport